MIIEVDTQTLTLSDAKVLHALIIAEFPQLELRLSPDLIRAAAENGYGEALEEGYGDGKPRLASVTVTPDPLTDYVSDPPPPANPAEAFAEPAALTDPAAAFGGAAPLSSGAATPDTAPTPAGASAPQLDADGLPWDERIHSTPAKLNASDGKWRAKRGALPAIVANVREELRARFPLPSTPPLSPSPAASTVTEGAATNGQSVTPTASPSSPPAPSPQDAALAAAAAGTGAFADTGQPPAVRFAAICKRITAAQGAEKLSPQDVAGFLTSLGITEGMRGLLAAPDLMDAFEALLAGMGA